MPKKNTQTAYVAEEFKKSLINTIKKILKTHKVIRTNNYDKNRSIAFEILDTDISIDFYNWNNGKVEYCDLYVGSDAIRYTQDQAQTLCDAFEACYREQHKEATVKKENQIANKLKSYMGANREK